VPASDGMGCPGAADSWFLVEWHAGAGRSKWCAVVVKSAMELGIGGEFRIDEGTMEESQGDQCLGEEPVL
jgi:hypothetical protein